MPHADRTQACVKRETKAHSLELRRQEILHKGKPWLDSYS